MGRRKRPKRLSSEPVRLSDALGDVVNLLGGALQPDDPETPRLDAILGADLAGRTEVLYRGGELRVYAATNGDATRLRFERSAIGTWAREAYGLGTDPEVKVLVGRPRKGGG